MGLEGEIVENRIDDQIIGGSGKRVIALSGRALQVVTTVNANALSHLGCAYIHRDHDGPVGPAE